MFEAKLMKAGILKKILDAIKDLVNESNFECSAEGISLQAMDTSHVALVSLLLKSESFEQFRCDKTLSLGINLTNLAKILKSADNEDILTMKADDNGDKLSLSFESSNHVKKADYELKLLDLDADNLGIPDTEYSSIVKMPSNEFQKTCRDLTVLGDTVSITTTKEGIRFGVTGDLGTGNITLKPTEGVDVKDEETVSIEIKDPVSLTFALRYLSFFTKATPLSTQVVISLSKDVPLVVEYAIEGDGFVKFFLAPKINEDE